VCSYPAFPTFTGDEQHRILFRHVHDVRVTGGHPEIGVAQQLLHRPQIVSMEITQSGRRMSAIP
jgi:hypothetical protein